jgi:hypothetical protein
MRVRLVSALLAVALLPSLSGCLIESTIDDKGGGTMKVELRVAPTESLDKVKARFTAPGVEIVKATMDDKKNAVIEIKYQDFRTLGALRQFENVTFSLTEDTKAKTRTAAAVAKYARPLTLPDDQLAYFGKDVKVSITVPGDIVKTDGKGTGKSASWTMPLNTLLGTPESNFSVTYKHSGAPLAKQAAAPAATAPAAKAPDAKAAGTPAK